MTHAMIWIVIIVVVTHRSHLRRTPTASSGAPVRGVAHRHRARSPSTCRQPAPSPRPHPEHTLPWCGFAKLGSLQPKSNCYKNFVLINTTVKLSLLTPKPEMTLMPTGSCWVARTVQALWEHTYSCCTELRGVFSLDDAVFGLFHHSSQCNLTFHSNKT